MTILENLNWRYAGAGFAEVLYLINVDKRPHELVMESERGKRYVLHPVHLSAAAADKRVTRQARFHAGAGRFVVPPRSVVVFVLR